MIEKVSPQYLEAKFEKREPWVTKFIIDGKTYGGGYYVANRLAVLTQLRTAK